MQPITLSFEVSPQTVQETALVLDYFLEALVKANELYYRNYPAGPCCPGCGGIRYAPPPPSAIDEPLQRFLGVQRLYVEGVGGCADIPAMVVARMRVLEHRPRVRCKALPQHKARREFHVVVELEDGSHFDPTLELEQVDQPVAPQGCGCAA